MERIKVMVLIVVSIVCVLGGVATMLPNLFAAEDHDSHALASEYYASMVQAGAIECFEERDLLSCGLTAEDIETCPIKLDDVDCDSVHDYLIENAETQRQIRNNYTFAFGFSIIAFVFGMFNILTGFWFWSKK